MSVVGYKVVDENFCGYNGFQYTVGGTYFHDGRVQVCESGFHFCRSPHYVWAYAKRHYRFCVVEASGTIVGGDEHKSACSVIHIIKELSLVEIMSLCNDDLPFVLSCACENDHVEAIEVLATPPFKHTYAPAAKDSAIFMACAHGHVEILNLLASLKFDIGHENARWTLAVACQYGHANIVKRLAEPPFNLTHEDVNLDSNRSLLWACAYGFVEIVKLLAAPPFNLTREDIMSQNCIAFRVAAFKGHTEITKLFMSPPYNVIPSELK